VTAAASRAADSRGVCLTRNPRNAKASHEGRPRNIRPRPGNRVCDNRSFPTIGPVSQAHSCHGFARPGVCPRPGLGKPRNTRSMTIVLPPPAVRRLSPAEAGAIAKRARKLLRRGDITHRQAVLIDCMLWSCRSPATGALVVSYTACSASPECRAVRLRPGSGGWRASGC
jgi:hypothetical protein